MPVTSDKCASDGRNMAESLHQTWGKISKCSCCLVVPVVLFGSCTLSASNDLCQSRIELIASTLRPVFSLVAFEVLLNCASNPCQIRQRERTAKSAKTQPPRVDIDVASRNCPTTRSDPDLSVWLICSNFLTHGDVPFSWPKYHPGGGNWVFSSCWSHLSIVYFRYIVGIF